MNAVTNIARQTPAQAAPTGPGGHAASSASKVDTTELVLDVTQMGLDIVGIFDPTPISDGASGILSLVRGDLLGAGISAVSMLPYVGDAAKLGKLGRYAETLAKAVDAAKASPEVAKAIGPAMDKLRQAIGAVPIDKLPEPLAKALEPLKSKLDDFARVGVNQVTNQVGKNSITWTQNAAGETIGARATLNEVFSGASRSSAEKAAQGTAAGRGVAGDVGGHLIGHRFAKDQGIKNMFPQNANFNNSAFKKVENEWADWITKKGGSVEVDVKLVGDSARPDKVKVSYQLLDANGNVVRQVLKDFDNQAGQNLQSSIFLTEKCHDQRRSAD